MADMEGTEYVYHTHHRSGHRLGFSILQDARGKFLQEHIGTGKHILDIGCRDGVLTRYFAKGNTVLGVDIDEGALQTAQKELGIETRKFDLNSAWPLENTTFDVVVAGEVLEHLYFPGEVIKRAAKVLKPNGMLLGSVPNAFSLRNRVRLALGQKKGTPLADPTHINHFTRSELLGLLKEHFKDAHITPAGRFAALDRFAPGFFAFDFLFEARNPKVQ